MKKLQKISIINCMMLALNWVIVILLCVFLCLTTNNICEHFIARDFIDKLEAFPWQPVRILAEAVVMMFLLSASFLWRELCLKENSRLEVPSLIFDFCISMLLMYVLNFNYNGILLWVFANIISRTKNSAGQFGFILLAVLSFVGTDYGLISTQYNLYNLQDYIEYYSSRIQSYLLGGFNLLFSLNMVLFIIYCIFVIQKQRGTIEEVNELYAQLSQANEDLQKANVELNKYAVMKEKMGETKERNRLAREIHDTLGHTLTGISAGLDACLAIIDVAPDKTKQQLKILSNVTREGIQEVRRSVSELRPDALERLGLEYAIRKLIKDTNSVTNNTTITFDCKLERLKFDTDEENAIYRVIQESVTNAIRHGHATRIHIMMEPQNGGVYLSVKDNGRGCEDMKSGFGTAHIKERIEMLKGHVEFKSSDGFLVEATIPIRWGEEYD